jgi:hypothetical protein
MNNFEWIDKAPTDTQIIADLIFNKKSFSTWLTLNMSYKSAQPGMAEFVFMDGRVYSNQNFRTPNRYIYDQDTLNKIVPFERWTPINIVGSEMFPTKISDIQEVKHFSGEQKISILEKIFGWQKVDDKTSLTQHFYYDLKAGLSVYKHPEWHYYLTIREEDLFSFIAPICCAETIDLEEFYAKVGV